jgi:Dolichyl-phosphate-mannose-protein mannosyltransferase
MSVQLPLGQARAPVRFLLAFFLAAALARLILVFATGFCDDEAYVVVISRAPALSYFDHPPLHQWVLTGWTALVGEGRLGRLPFFACSLVTSFALFGLARRLFSTQAAWWTLFAFSASAYFLVYPDGYIMPDLPLLMFLALGTWAVAEILFGPPGRETPLWLIAGLALGLAGLSKYSAIFAPLGLIGFFLTSPTGRRWLSNPRPYLAAAIALVCVAPAIVWNAEHGWVSLAFQSGRAARVITFDPKALGEILAGLGAQIAAMSPWILLPLLAGLGGAFRRGADVRQRFLLWLAAPPLIFFALIPLLGERAISHWFNSGWLFAFPLAGRWLAERSPRFLQRFLALSVSLSALIIVGYLAALLLGPFDLKGVRDPTRGMYDWPAGALREAYLRAGAKFVLIENWRLGGRVGVALGPSIPVCAMGGDPRGFAFACDARMHLGEDALIVRAQDNGRAAEEATYFQTVEPMGEAEIGRKGHRERVLSLEAGRRLLTPPPLPYGP